MTTENDEKLHETRGKRVLLAIAGEEKNGRKINENLFPLVF